MAELLDETALVSRLASCSKGGRPVVFLLGSGVSLPRKPGGLGVPSSAEIIGEIRKRIPGELSDGVSYQAAFKRLEQLRGQDEVNDVIQQAVLRACRTAPGKVTEQQAADLEADWKLWEIPPGLSALAALAAHHPQTFGKTILTTNFDPLIELALSRTAAPWYSTALHQDGSLLYLHGSGVHVAHIHGHWSRSDTLNTEDQLKKARKQLKASLTRTLAESVVVVVGYGGWEDAFMSALADAVAGNASKIDLLWTFFSDDEAKINANSAKMFRRLEKASIRGRVHYYKGIDVDSFATKLFGQLSWSHPAESISLYLERVLFALSRPQAYRDLCQPWASSSAPSSFSDFITPLACFSVDDHVRAALFSVEYMLPYLEEAQPTEPYWPRKHEGIRRSLELAIDMLNRGDRSGVSEIRIASMEAYEEAGKFGTNPHDRTMLLAASSAFRAVLHRFEKRPGTEAGVMYSGDNLADVAIHNTARASFDRNDHLALYLKSRFNS